MRVVRSLALFGVVSTGMVGILLGQGNETVRAEVEASGVSGIVYGGRREEGYPLKDVRVLQCDPTFRSCRDVAKTDVDGKYTLSGAAERLKKIYLEFLLPGFNEVQLTVKVRRSAAKLEVVLPVGT